MSRLLVVAFAVMGGLAGVSASLAADDAPHGRAAYAELLKRQALANGLPVDIADAVVAVESGYDPARIGSVGEIGLMQVRPATAAMLGFKGNPVQLADPETNIHLGVTYLAGAWRLAHGDLCRALMKYRAGHGEEAMTPRSVEYCARARQHLAAIGSAYAGAPLAVVSLLPGDAGIAAAIGRQKSPKRNLRLKGAAFWVMHEARIKAINARIERRWRQVASR